MAELVTLFGPSTGGKTFVMLDMAMSIARGVPWRGLKTRQHRVAYICAEGGGGFRNRVKAYGLFHQVDLDTIPFGIIHTAPNFLMGDDLKHVRDAILLAEGAGVIVVDTFAKVTPGSNENAGEDVGKALDNCRKLHEATGAVVILVHHTGKDVSKGARGWSGLKAAADAQLEVVFDEAAGKRWIATDKQKDARGDAKWGFKLEVVPIEMDEDGDTVDSCVILEDEAPTGRRAGVLPKALKHWPAAVMEALADLRGVTGAAVKLPDLITAAAEKRPEAGELRHRKANAKRAIEGLAKGRDARLIIEAGGSTPLVLEAQD
jgi:hypothetical protein